MSTSTDTKSESTSRAGFSSSQDKENKDVSEFKEVDLSILLKFVRPYDGSRDTLQSFLNNCGNAFSLASGHQKKILFQFILSQLHGKADTACSIKEFTGWAQLKEFLITQFGERKTYTHLLTDLQECKQLSGESATQFALKVETYLAQLITEITLSCNKKCDLSGRLAAMQDVALNTFLLGLHPRLSSDVRVRSPKTLNEAINFAVSEEKIYSYMCKKNPSQQNRSSFQNRPTQFQNASPRPQFQNRFQRPFQSQNMPRANTVNNDRPNPNNSRPFCRYCKYEGHTIETCRKREYNNRRFGNSPNQGRFTQPVHNIVSTLESSDGGTDEVDTNLNE